MQLLANAPLHSILNENQTAKRGLLQVAIGVLLLAVMSQVSIPLMPVPITFQSVTVIFLAMIYGARLGTYTVLSYLALGACGVPVFAEFSGGLAVLLGTNGGYLLGFVAAALVCGYLSQYGFAGNIIKSFIAALIGDLIIFSLGIAYLSAFIGWHQAVAFGLMPFIITESVKLICVAIAVPRFWHKQKDA